MPHKMDQECLHCTPWACDYSNVITWYSVYAGTYQLVVFHNSERPGDYAISQGIEEVYGCEDLAVTVDYMKQAASGELYQKSDCVNAGESGFAGCAPSPWP